jgi:hypothetical protein
MMFAKYPVTGWATAMITVKSPSHTWKNIALHKDSHVLQHIHTGKDTVYSQQVNSHRDATRDYEHGRIFKEYRL